MKGRFLSGCLLFILTVTVLPAYSLTPAYPITGTYSRSTYYQNLLELPVTGNAAFDTVAVALSQLDYHEGDSIADFDGANGSGIGNLTEYNHAFGKIGGTYGYAWCAAFVSWCLQQAGEENAAGGRYASCTLWVERLQSLSRYKTRASGAVPEQGDLIFFRSVGVTRASDHVGIVRYTANGRVYTVEGNSSNRVTLRDYALNDTYIVGYGKPAYSGTGNGSVTAALSLSATAPGYYTVTNETLNVRAGRGTQYTRYGTLSRGEMFAVKNIRNGWGEITYKGKKAYISLQYTCFTSPFPITVTYLSEDSQGCPSNETYMSHETPTVSAGFPTRDGYIFSAWKDGSGKIYKPGEVLPAESISLTAVWDVVSEDYIEDSDVAPPLAHLPTEPLPDAEFSATDVSTDPVEEAPSASAASRDAGVICGLLAAAWLTEVLRRRLSREQDN